MKTWKCAAVGALLFLLPQFVSANLTTISYDPAYAEAPFIARCNGSYSNQAISSFYKSGYHYTPTNGPCLFSLPKTLTGTKVIGLYQGTVGNSIFLAGNVIHEEAPSPTLMQESSIAFHDTSEDQDFFFVIYNLDISPNDIFHDYLTGAATTLPEGAVENETYYILPWKWGEKPPSEYDPVVILPGILGSWEKNGEWVIDPILHTYANLIDTFLANGYIENETLFEFPYDWKNSNITTASILKNKIEEIKEVCDCDHVDIIGHSMGGLVGLQYILRDDYENDVDQLILVATPVSGAPSAYKTWEGGELDFGHPIRTALMKRIFKNDAKKNGYADIFSYIRQYPVVSIQELLPINYDYNSTATGPLAYPDGYPGNLFLHTLHTDFIDTSIYTKVDIQLVQANTNTGSTIDGYVVESSTELPKWEHGKPVNEIFGPGDGTVPSWSTENLIGPSVVFEHTNHNVVASSSAPWIFDQLNNKEPQIIVGEEMDLDVSFLLFQLFSPIDMQIIAPDGKRLGKDFETNEELNEIPSAFYSGFEKDNEYAIILNPIPGEYKIKTTGTGNGSYAIVADYSDQNTMSSAEIIGTTTLAQLITHTASLSATSSITLTLENTPTPLPEEKITPGTCIADMNTAYKNKWITKKSIYTRLVADCRLLGTLFKTRDLIEKAMPAKRDKLQKLLLATTDKAIANTFNLMDKLAKDKSIKKEARNLINKNTQWFREHQLSL